jgi:glycogen debranching enzyme
MQVAETNDSTMSHVSVRPELLHAWHGQSLFVVNASGECGEDQTLSGFYFREARHLRTLRLVINGERPWLCEAAAENPTTLRFAYVYPELTEFGGGGSGQSDDHESTDRLGIAHRSLDVRVTHRVGIASLSTEVKITNRGRRDVSITVGWALDADFADIAEALESTRQQNATISLTGDARALRYSYDHPDLPYCTRVTADGPGVWNAADGTLSSALGLRRQETATLVLRVFAEDGQDELSAVDLERREAHLRAWRECFTHLTMPGNGLAEAVLESNARDFASLPLLQGREDEWLAMQAGMPLYPALFGRDTLTAGWQAAFLDRGASLDASLTRLGRMQSDRTDEWRDAEPGRLPHEVRLGPLARLGRHPRDAYYGDYAGPLMFVIALAHLYAWTGEKSLLDRHWDAARRALDWARERGDLDGDGYLEYRTRSPQGLENQGWKDSGDAILYDDGSPVPRPIGTCELQGYWFTAQQLMAVLSWVMDAPNDAKAHWSSATELKRRFNRDWWMEDDGFIALAMDPDKRLVRAVSSNVGHCVAAGIVSDEHLPRVVGRLFAADMFSGWGVRTLSAGHVAYNPLSYHLGSVWAVENATIAFGLRRFGFDERALELSRAMFDLAALYPDYRIPETVGGYARADRPFPGAYPRANAPQLWNASAMMLLVHTMLGLQPVAPLHLLVVDPVLPTWLPEIVLHGVRLGGATSTIRFWRDVHGESHAEVVRKSGTLHVIKQPPLESLRAGVKDRFTALTDRLLHH